MLLFTGGKPKTLPAIYYQDAVAQRYGLDPRTIDPDDGDWRDFIGRLGAMQTIQERAKKSANLHGPTEE